MLSDYLSITTLSINLLTDLRRHSKVVNWLLNPYDINPKEVRLKIAQAVIEQGEYGC